MPRRSCARQLQCFVRTWHPQPCSEVLCAYQSKPLGFCPGGHMRDEQSSIVFTGFKKPNGTSSCKLPNFPAITVPRKPILSFAKTHSRRLFSDSWGLIKSWQAIPVSTSFAQITEPLRTSHRDAGIWGWCTHSCRLRWGDHNYSLWSNAPQVFFCLVSNLNLSVCLGIYLQWSTVDVPLLPQVPKVLEA